MPLWVLPLFLAAFPLFWAGTCWIIAQMGWARLASRYRTEAEPTGQRLWVGHANVGPASYKNVLRVWIEPEGLRLGVLFLFRPGHPPLRIPWDAITDVRPRKVLWQTQYVLDIGTPPVTTLAVPESVVKAIAEAAPTPLPGRSAI